MIQRGQVAQLVEHGTENPGVVGSIPTLPTKSRIFQLVPFIKLRLRDKGNNLSANVKKLF